MKNASDQAIIRCDPNCLKEVHEFVRQRAAGFGLSRTDVGRFVLAADEVCSNILQHSYGFQPNHKIVLSWHDRGDSAVLEIEDDSPIPYLPSPTDFDLPTKVKYRHPNGYGKYLIRRAIDDVQYETVPGSYNKVSLIKFRTRRPVPSRREGALSPYDLARERSVSLLLLFEMGQNLADQQSVAGLMKAFLYSVVGRLTVHPAALLAPISASSPFCVVGEVGLSPEIALASLGLSRDGWVVEALSAQRGPFLVDQFRKMKIPKGELKVLEEIQAALLIPIFHLNQLRGILALGAKRSRQPFSEEDVNLVTFLSSYVLLLKEDLERGGGLAEGAGATEGGEIRAACRVAIAKLAKASREAKIPILLAEGPSLPHTKMDPETLQKVVVTLLTHTLYLARTEGSVDLRLIPGTRDVSLEISYQGGRLGF